MVPGDLVGGRFELERIAGLGGMGTVFRGVDRVANTPVAVKVLFEAHVLSDARFEREAQMLSEFSHPGLVRYVAHGVSPKGERFLVMEWLEGEDLSRRLQRSRLSIDDSVILVGRVAEALAAVHARGVVHRDLKPSNIFLVGGSIENVKILDFGVARFSNAAATTQTGTVLGTPGYMAPEQARSGQAIDSRVDVFALGCVLFEALTGTPAFAGAHLMAMLAKILFEEAPRVSDLRPEVPDALDDLVARMLAKNADDRPRDGADIARTIASLASRASQPGDVPRSSQRLPAALTGGEQRLLSVVLVGGATREAAVDAQMRDIADARGGRFERLADGSVMVTIAGTTRIAADQAAHGARCALALLAAAPARTIALATGRAEVTGRLPVGDAIDRAARMLALRAVTAPEGEPGIIVIDDVTAGLLDARFDVRAIANGFELHGEREAVEGARTLLGTPTICVGRDREIAALHAMFVECEEGPTAQAVLVTAPAGAGKSRLLHEALRVVRRRSGPVEVWTGRGDPLRVGSAFSMLGQALRSACRLVDGEPVAARAEKIRARVAEHVPAAEQRRVAEFLGEIVGTPFPDDESVPLRVARQDALLMGEQMRRAFEDFLRAEAEARPVILVLEDLHWGDLPTVRFVDGALKNLKSSAFMVIALARPEVHELFPRLWQDRAVEEMRLKELTPKACGRLVRQVLGDRVGDRTVERLVAQADGHAFFLEELIRAVAEGRGDALPETVLATVEARLEGLEVEARRVLRAASIFGEGFWLEGVVALLGGGDREPRVRQWLATLVEREVLVRHADSRFAGEHEYAFRHALLREAAYAMLTEADRVLGHRLAAEWLERHAESDPMVLAEHFERARVPERAGALYLRAAESAQRGGDTDATIGRARRGLECEVSGSVRIGLLGMLCEAHAWRREWPLAEPYADDVMRLAPQGSEPWALAAPAKLIVALTSGRIAEFMATLHLLQTVEPEPDAAGAMGLCFAAGTFALDAGGRFDLAAPAVRRYEAIVSQLVDDNPIARAWHHMIESFHGAWSAEAPWKALDAARRGQDAFFSAGHFQGVAIARVFVGMCLWFLGALDEAERELRATLLFNDEELGMVSSTRRVAFVGVLADKGLLDEARAEAERIIERGRAHGMPADEGRGRWLLAEVLRRTGDLEAAEREATPAIEMLATSALDQTAATATLAAVLLARGRKTEALAAARTAMEKYEAMGAFGYRGSFARLVHIEALEAAGEITPALAALTVARDRLSSRAASIEDAAARRTLLEAVPENARTLALASERLGP